MRLPLPFKRRSSLATVTLAIDDGPSDVTPRLLEQLELAGHRAVLFVLGCNVAGREHVMVDALRRGFALGNHSFHHPRFSSIELPEARAEIQMTEALIDSAYTKARVRRPGRWVSFSLPGHRRAAVRRLSEPSRRTRIQQAALGRRTHCRRRCRTARLAHHNQHARLVPAIRD